MLPDFPKLKARIAELHRRRVNAARNAHLGVFADVKVSMIHEGVRSTLLRDDGTEDTMQMNRVEATATLNTEPNRPENIDFRRVLDMLDELGADMAKQQLTQMFKKVNEAVESVGNVIDMSGVEGILAGMEKVAMDFDGHGNPIEMTMVFGSEETRDKVRRLHEEIQRTPELRCRYDAIIAKKREEWRDREAARNLVE